jgi:hypothetical protein
VSVIGLMLSLTQVLMRTRSLQALLVSTMSRGRVGVTLHSSGRSAQNSTQPIGGRVAAPAVTNSSSCATLREATLAISAIAQPTASILLYSEVIVAPSVRPWGYILTKPLGCR